MPKAAVFWLGQIQSLPPPFLICGFFDFCQLRNRRDAAFD
ncbi:hypothetical protein NMH_0396 [Neisseria meningitidis H44/76]|uniref:Uncharacterized protein n=2 Tax=Neisseria meningitidis TaxID=487 RepID=E6MUF0_NEIMH|nr:hypothetical protein NMH_0396 [Neisseria meningitidis H44/76]KER39809.1 hypothetical protein F528_1236 [Neisseria meningitidis 992008]CCA44796.1 hypothetical protein NMALPHA522_1255 [Neisseria meningitidis alpha522]